jgi:hypothetical protein
MMMKREGDERKGRAMNKMETRIKEIKKTKNRNTTKAEQINNSATRYGSSV